MNFLSNIFSGLGNLIKPITSMFSGGGQSPAPRTAWGNTASMAQQIPSGQLYNSPYQKGAPNLPSKSTGSNSFMDSGWMKSLFPGGTASGIAGIAAPLIGNMFAPKVKTPEIKATPNVQALQNFRPGNSVSPEYQTMLNNNIDRLRNKRIQDLQATYRSARPGTDYLTDTNYQRDLAEIERSVQTQLSDDLASAEGTFSAQEQNRLSELAQLDVAQLMMQYGLDAEEANNFKQMFSNVGNMFLTRATRDPNEFSVSDFFRGR